MADLMHRPGFRFYQSANADAEMIKDDFIIRRHEYEIIIQDIRCNPMKGSVQHYLLLGRRGSGKSTLLKRIQVEIDSDLQLSKTHIAINLAEEQANIYKLYDLLEAVIQELEYRSIQSEQILWEEDEHTYSRNLFRALHTAVEKSGKKLVLLLDNIDRIFENVDEDAALLREYLLNYDDIKIIGGSTRMTEHFWKYNKPFYQFFRVLELKPLTSAEIRQLLLHWAAKLDLPKLKEFVEHKTGQLEMVRILTDGLPRTLQFFVDILIAHTQETGYEYLRLIMDQVTPLYQERLNSLPPAQRKIVLQMAFLWEAGGAKELAAATKMDNKVVSAQLKQLSDKGIAEKIETSTKNHLYRLSERFFNLWLIFTQGNPHEKRRAKCLTVFLENFYDEEELRQLALVHLDVLQAGKMLPNKAALLTKALAQSKYISYTLRDDLIGRTLNLKGIDNELKQQLPLTTRTVCEKIRELVDRKEWTKALNMANDFEQHDAIKDFMIAYVNEGAGNYEHAQEYYLNCIDKGYVGASNNLANTYLRQAKFELAEKYYLGSIEKEGKLALNNLAVLYDGLGKPDLARKYYLQAIESGDNNALYNFAYFLYNTSFDKDAAYEYIERARTLTPDNDKVLRLWVGISAWNGKMEAVAHHITQTITAGKYDNLYHFFIHLLVHKQTNLVLNLFANEKFGRELEEKFQPIYYVAILLTKRDEMAALKIPPEIKETLDEMVKMVNEMQEHYYGKS